MKCFLSYLPTCSYDRISPSFRGYLESLTALCAQPVFRSAAEAGNYEVMSPRGSPLNADDVFAPNHPVIRTNRVTGWKSVFAGVGIHVTKINDVYSHEDQLIRDYIMRLITRNHDCIARMHWTKNAAAIWNNSCTLHAATVRLREKWNRRVLDRIDRVYHRWSRMANSLAAGHASRPRNESGWKEDVVHRGGSVS